MKEAVITQLSVMLLVPDRARADVLIKEDRIYYRFATESTEDEGDLPGLNERFAVVAERLLEDIRPLPDETVVPSDDMKVSIFVNNVVKPTQGITEQAIKRLVNELVRIDDAFAFMQGFV